MIKTATMIKARAYIHKEYMERAILSVAKSGVLHQIDALESLKDFEPKVKAVESTERLFKSTSIISRIQALLSSVEEKPEPSILELKVLSAEEIDSIDRLLSEIEQKYNGNKEIGMKPTLSIEDLNNLLLWERQLEATRLVEEAKSKCAQTEKIFIIEGWIPKDKKENFENAVIEGSKGCCVTSYLLPAQVSGHSQESPESPPTLIRNPRIAYVYEKLVTGFGIPNYFEIDPTIFMTFSFPLIFGLIFGDVGHGLVLLALSLLLYAVNRKGIRAPELFEYIIKGSPLLVMCSASSIFFGFLYGEMFGSEKYYHIIDELIHHNLGVSSHEIVEKISKNLELTLSGIAGFSIPVPFPFSPFDQPTLLLLVSLYVAMLHITFGLVLGLINELRRKNYLEAIVGPGLWLWFYLSFAYLLLKYKSGIFSAVFQDMNILGVYIALPAVIMILARASVHGIDGFGHALESLISSLSNSISYGRILALAVAHAAFSKILLMMLEFEGIFAIVGWLMWAIFTFLLILCFECLLSFIHTLRLHWVEWFLKFYTGDGYRYEPLKI
ncbi:MAG: V-type ATPase 116kDa subunit family protein [Candidatus Bathyarchaeia archaeon]|nr:hypothetical protein [Candidatus Bathyarchaeota archaeon]